MKINNHLLEGPGVDFQRSPNMGPGFRAGLPDTIIIHYTAGSSADSSVKTLTNPRVKASAHLVCARDGSITQLVPFDTQAWHAGKSTYGDRTGFNKYSIGIEVDNPGKLTRAGDGYIAWFGTSYPKSQVIEAVHRNGSKPEFWHTFTEAQIASVREVCEELMETYSISSILGHEEIAPGRKVDPGPAFPLDQLRTHLRQHDRGEDAPLDPLDLGNAGLVTASKLNIRTGPYLGADLAAPPLDKGTIVEVISEQDGWYQVDLKTRGWVKKDYIDTT